MKSEKVRYQEPTRVVHDAIKIADNDYWVLLSCGHVNRQQDGYHESACPLCLGDNRKYTAKQFRKEYRIFAWYRTVSSF